MLHSAMETEPYIVGTEVTNQLINLSQVFCYEQITEGNLLRMNPVSLLLHFSNEAFEKKTAVYMMWQTNNRWVDSTIQNFPSATTLLVSWSNCLPPRQCQSLATWEIKRLGQTRSCGISFAFQACYSISRCQRRSRQLAKTPHVSFSSSLLASVQEVLCSISIHNANATEIWTEVNTPGKAPHSGTTKHWRKLRPPLGLS